MSNYSDEEMERLLARGGLSGPDRDRVFGRVLAQVASASPKRSLVFRRLVFSLGAAGSVAIAFLMLWILGVFQGDSNSGFLAKGDGKSIVVEVGCRHGSEMLEGQCFIGDSLLLRVEGINRDVYIAAYSEGPNGNRIWYFPTENGFMPRLSPQEGPQLVDRTILIGSDHPTGRYRLWVMLFSSPAERSQLTSEHALSTQSFALEVGS